MEYEGKVVNLGNPSEKIKILRIRIGELEAKIQMMTSHYEETIRLAAEREQELIGRVKDCMDRLSVKRKPVKRNPVKRKKPGPRKAAAKKPAARNDGE